MKTGERFAWITASLVAVALHSSALVAFASLLQERSGPPTLTVNFESDDWLKQDQLEEATVAEPVPEEKPPLDAVSAAPADAAQTESRSTETVKEQAETIQLNQSNAPNAVTEAPALETAATQASDDVLAVDQTDQNIASVLETPPAAYESTEPRQAETVQEQLSADAVAETATSEPSNTVAPQTAEPTVAQIDESTLTQTEASSTDSVAADNSAAPLTPSTPPTPVTSELEAVAADPATPEVLGEPNTVAEVNEAVLSTTPSQVIEETKAVAEDLSAQIAILQPKAQPQSLPDPPQTPTPPVDIGGTISGYRGGSCFLALPAQTPQGTWHVTSYGASEAEFSGFDAFLASNNIGDIKKDQLSIQATQCSAVGLAQAFARSKDESLTLTIENPTVADGALLQARIAGMERKWVYVLLVDDDGLAQDVSKYAALRSGAIEINMPVFVKGGGRERTQLLIAISSDAAINLLDLKQPEPLADILPLIKGEIAASEAKVSVALSHFQVK